MRRLALLASVLGLALAAAPAQGAARARALPPVRHVFVIVLENQSYDQTFSDQTKMPYLSSTLASQGALLPYYWGITHESLGNYVAMVSGQGPTPETQTDCQTYAPFVQTGTGAHGQALGHGCVYPAGVRTVADQLAGRHLSWKGYMEDMGTACRHPVLGAPDTTQHARLGDQYAARHNPFVYFHSLLDSGACARDDVPLTQLPADLASARRTPALSFITPNLCDDGHDAPCVDGRPGGPAQADAFLRQWVPRILRSPAYRAGGLLVVTFDEAESIGANGDASGCCGIPRYPNVSDNGFIPHGQAGGRVGAVALSPYIGPGTISHVDYDHFSFLRTVEDLYGLPHLGYAGLAGTRTFGADLFTCWQPRAPRARRGRYALGALIRRATFLRGTAARP